jgi:lipopolysaccharide/colanic/teichoic acid biosynthesis glycosyltransferase
LINVLRGDMSLVGPRPELEEHTQCYSEEERVILTVRPGITDYASVKFVNLAETLGKENADAAYVAKVRPEKNRLRVQYVRHRTLWTDVKLILITILTVVRQRPWNMPS